MPECHNPRQVWDIRNHKCMQTFHDDETYRPENLITAMMYDNSKRWLVTGNVKLKVSVRGATFGQLCGGGCLNGGGALMHRQRSQQQQAPRNLPMYAWSILWPALSVRQPSLTVLRT